MQKYKNKLVYDANTGEVRDDRRYQTMLEDFWLPRREGGRGTEITTLPGGQNLGEIDDVLYFQKKLYKSLNVPASRLEADTGFSLGRASEITRDEVKFSKFVGRLRMRFSHLFDRLLETQLLLKGVCTKKEWLELKENINYDFISDSHFIELKETEIMRERISMLNDMDQYVGKYFSHDYIKKNILKMSEEDIKEIGKEIDKEGSDEEYEERIEDEKPQPKISNETFEFIPKETEDQSELAKSMSKFFDSLVEEGSNDKEEK